MKFFGLLFALLSLLQKYLPNRMTTEGLALRLCDLSFPLNNNGWLHAQCIGSLAAQLATCTHKYETLLYNEHTRIPRDSAHYICTYTWTCECVFMCSHTCYLHTYYHMHAHVPCANTPTSYAQTVNPHLYYMHRHTPYTPTHHTQCTQTHTSYMQSHITSPACVHTWIFLMNTHNMHTHILWQIAHTPHMYTTYIQTTHSCRLFPLHHTCTGTHTYHCMHMLPQGSLTHSLLFLPFSLCMYIFFSVLTPGSICIGLYRTHTQKQQTSGVTQKHAPRPWAAQPLCISTYYCGPLPLPQKVTLTKKHLHPSQTSFIIYIFLPLIKSHNEMGCGIIVSLKWTFHKKRCLNWDASDVFIFTKLRPAVRKKWLWPRLEGASFTREASWSG